MSRHFKLDTLNLAIRIAFAMGASTLHAADFYPALPPALSTSVPPNVVLYLDTSGSMLQDTNNDWMLTSLCNSNSSWSNCVNYNTNSYRTNIDSSTTSPNTKMNIAKRVAKTLVANNPSIRFGLFSFEDKSTSTGGTERGQGAIKRADVKDMTARTYASSTTSTTAAMATANNTALNAAIDALNGRTSTPLGEGLLEITRYFRGKSSIYKTGTYTSPIQYRCQKNFALVITDGDASDENDFTAETYTARDSDGTAVSKSFSVCTAANSIADDGKTVNCPVGLEKSDGTYTTSRDFGSSTNRISALRDVAKYGQVADLQVGGTDLDGNSFDSTPFFMQTMATYTVGFSVSNDVLPAAAKAGGGKYYTATSETELSSSLAQAIDSIVASTSNAGGVATQSEVTTTGNKVFQPVFNPSGWYGELRCYYLVNNAIGSACSPSKVTIPAAGSRNIYSSKVIGTTTTPFAFNDSAGYSAMTSGQKTLLGTTAAGQKNTINFLRGTEGISGFRTRPVVDSVTTFLGDIIDGQPVVVSAPSGYTYDTAYAAFQTANSTRNMVLVGANDGMLHAFSIDTMAELAGYIPAAVYPRLSALTASDYGLSGGTLHTYHVNGSMLSPMDFKTSATGSWKTMVVGGLGQGGQGYYALDTTSTSSFSSASSMVKWEWNDTSDSSIGYSFGMPIMSNVRTSPTTTVPAVIFSNGYENSFDDTSVSGQKTSSNSSALFIVKADDGTLLKKITLPTTGTYKSEGLSSPWGVDVAQDGILDYVYAGDVNGNMWRFDLTADYAADFKVVTDASNNATPIFKAATGQPITMRPATLSVYASDGTGIGNMVLFGTGQLLTDADRTTTTTQSLYGILDKMASTVTTITASSSLQVQTINSDQYTVTSSPNLLGTYRKVSTNDIDVTDTTNTKLGWYINLPASSERLVASPKIYSNRVLFGTGIPLATEQCTPGGTGWIMGLNPLTGSVTTKNNVKPSTGVAFSFIDINGDSKSSSADKLAFSSGSAYVSGIATSGIPTELSYVAASSDLTTLSSLSTTDPYSGAGGFVAMREANSQGVGTGVGAGGRQGQVINRIQSTGAGTVCSGTIGSESLQCLTAPAPPTSGIKIEHTVWREIK
jgi:type IV pilus assembly protein PilY1